MKLLNPLNVLLLSLATVGLGGCFKQTKAPESPRRGAKAGECPAPASASGGAYLAGAKGTWEEVKTLLERDCTSCHPSYNEYDTAKILADKFVKTTDDGQMPKDGEKLAFADRQIYILWANNGAPKDGVPNAGGTTTPTTETPVTETPATEKPSTEESSPDDDPPPPASDETESSCS